MHAPVDQRAAAGGRKGGEIAAQTRDRTVRAEGGVDVIDLAQLARRDQLADLFHIGVEAVAHADIQQLAGLMRGLLHLERLAENARRRLLAHHMLAGPQEIDRDDRMEIVVGTDGNGVQLRVVEELVIIDHGLSATVFLDAGLRLLGNQVAEILDLRHAALEIGGNMRAVGDIAAADDGDFIFFHKDTSAGIFVIMIYHSTK